MKVVTLVLILLCSVLLAVFELVLQPLHAGSVPVPAGTIVAIVTMPWLVRGAGAEFGSAAAAGLPIVAFVLTLGVLGTVAPGGDVMLPATWQSGLLAIAGIGAGLVALRGIVMRPGTP
ncbi:hypothetical protein PSU4_31060 [Pseudonocardia sulfidoxydans NBRC 16205]|uniref:Uncharacterized protein n=1 Tax=Pseudonocardia sulfidoxydans NBRC 16205 TaxID=1223511 RepID=A0A511DH88_9PSEU|nr:hypothetical protein [Pseudonocardia sulfidoxydans]GEL24152.1 hypothetical protein PSU4_31060 [Pseudonocardia sulfidoxydans NBRC 16205]